LALPDVARFLLEVDELNHQAIRLYDKMGFSPYHRREKYYKNGHAAIMMERKMRAQVAKATTHTHKYDKNHSI